LLNCTILDNLLFGPFHHFRATCDQFIDSSTVFY